MLYIHIPFCRKKCIYCNFYSGGNPDWDKYFKAVASELSKRIDELRGDSLKSIYIGGGTPSLIPSTKFKLFIKSVWNILESENIQLDPDIEVTLEVNPEDVTDEKASWWKCNHINRISMGVQSLNDAELQLINRRHTSTKASEAFRILSRHFNNISIDIIYGLPGQTIESLSNTLTKIATLAPKHISLYALTYEEKTPLSTLRDTGRLTECSEEIYLEMETLAIEFLRKQGYVRYEVSNFSKPGYKSRHNSGYWTGYRYLGLGPSACSYDGDGIRRNNPLDIKKYIDHFINDSDTNGVFYEEEILSSEEKIEERIMVGLRTADGIDLNQYATDFGENEMKRLLGAAGRWIDSADLKSEKDRLILTDRGFSKSNYIILSLV